MMDAADMTEFPALANTSSTAHFNGRAGIQMPPLLSPPPPPTPTSMPPLLSPPPPPPPTSRFSAWCCGSGSGCSLSGTCASSSGRRRNRRRWVAVDAVAASANFALRPLWKPSQGGALCPLQRTPECVVRGQRYRCIEAVVDSGAEETVAPRGAFPGQHRASAMSRAGACYRTASGAPVPNLGEQDVQFLTNEGYAGEIPFQLADIERPLIAVSSLAKAGNVVELNQDGGTITNQATGKVTGIERRGGTYVLRMWVPTAQCPSTPFQRQGAR